MPDASNLPWWQTAVFYQIYPRSFADGNGDGIGDLAGITGRLNYLADLGIDAIWLSPFFPSPQFDVGYDVADYTGVDPEYGTLETFKQLLDKAHSRGMRIILDLVMNHTSDRHPWFMESKSSRHNPRRDWYIWREGREGGPPNNWSGYFDESAWTFDPRSEQWYYHMFFKEQPDLNWRNPEVKAAMFDVVRFWLEMGVDGFRLDAIHTLYEDQHLPDHRAGMDISEQFKMMMTAGSRAAMSPEQQETLLAQREQMTQYQVDQPEIHALLRELRKLVDQFPDRVLVGEVEGIEYYGDGSNELHMVFNFPLMRLGKLSPAAIRKNQEERLAKMPAGAWPGNTLNNHDSSRVFNHTGDGINDARLARLSLALMLTLKGTPFLYNGEEIGMQDMMLPAIDLFRDNLGVWLYRKALDDFGMAPEIALPIVQRFTRDRCRTPMQWSAVPNAGFSPEGVRTWLPVHPNYSEGVNVAEQEPDPGSLLNFYKDFLALRKKNPALRVGDFEPLHIVKEQYFAFSRQTQDQNLLVVLNFSGQVQSAHFGHASAGKLVFSSDDRREVVSLQPVILAPFEILIMQTGSE